MTCDPKTKKLTVLSPNIETKITQLPLKGILALHRGYWLTLPTQSQIKQQER